MTQHLLTSLSQTQLDMLLAQLLERRQTLQNALNSAYGETDGPTLPAPLEAARHRDESAAHYADDEVRDALSRHDDDELQQIGAAIARMDLHRYGVCISCGEEIPYERLVATPFAARCIACQGDADRHQAMATGHGKAGSSTPIRPITKR